MIYEFNIVSEKNHIYEVEVCIKNRKDHSIKYNDIMTVKYIDGIVLLDLKYIQENIKNEIVRLDFISKLKEYIKSIQ